jgi:diphthamide synthase subunit DPH2
MRGYFVDGKVEILEEVASERLSCFSEVGVQRPRDRVALPRELDDSLSELSRRDGKRHVVLADSSRCCIDNVAANHSLVDCIIKTGYTCPLIRGIYGGEAVARKVFYFREEDERNKVLEKRIEKMSGERRGELEKIDEALLPLLRKIFEKKVLVALSPDLLYLEDGVLGIFKHIREQACAKGGSLELWRYEEDLQEHRGSLGSKIIAVSDEEKFTGYFMANYPDHVLLGTADLSPLSGLCEKLVAEDESQAAQRRSTYIIGKLHLAEKIREASTVGIVFTLPEHIDLAEPIKAYLDMHNKKFYTFFLNGLKPDKLGNFLGVDVFVIVQCPFYHFKFDSTIVSVHPFDLVLAFSEKWDGVYSTRLDYTTEEMRRGMGPMEKTSAGRLLAVREGCNRLTLCGDLPETRVRGYFRTGEALREMGGMFVKRSAENPEELENTIKLGRTGIPTEYRYLEQ